MSEIMLPIYCDFNNLKVRYDEWVPNVGEKSKGNKLKRSLRNFIVNTMFRIWPDKIDGDWAAIQVGLKNDGIILA
jgi:hypothetical protein